MQHSGKGVRICWFGIYNPQYSRNYVLLDGLKECSVEVIECNVSSKLSFVRKYVTLMRKLIALRGQFDFVYVAFPAQTAVLAARLCTRKPVVMDAFYSMYENIVHDRKTFAWYHPFALTMLFLDWISTVLATRIIVDTTPHKHYWSGWWGVRSEKIRVVPVGSSTHYFFPTPVGGHTGLLVHFQGTYIPLQGVDVIIEAAALLRDEQGVHFRLIGDGQTYADIRNLAQAHAVSNVTFLERVSLAELNRYLNEADVSLGIFGSTQKADRVVPNKVYEALAVGKAIITKDTKAVREVFTEAEVAFVKPSPDVLAEMIMNMRDQKVRERYAGAGHVAFKKRFAQKPIARKFLDQLSDICHT